MIEIEIAETEKSNEWKSCCFIVDRNVVNYGTQVAILASLIVFSATMLVVQPSCESQTVSLIRSGLNSNKGLRLES